MIFFVFIIIFEVTHTYGYENEIFITKEMLPNTKIASKIQESIPMRHFDGLQTYPTEQNMLYRAKKLPLEPNL